MKVTPNRTVVSPSLQQIPSLSDILRGNICNDQRTSTNWTSLWSLETILGLVQSNASLPWRSVTGWTEDVPASASLRERQHGPSALTIIISSSRPQHSSSFISQKTLQHNILTIIINTATLNIFLWFSFVFSCFVLMFTNDCKLNI